MGSCCEYPQAGLRVDMGFGFSQAGSVTVGNCEVSSKAVAPCCTQGCEPLCRRLRALRPGPPRMRWSAGRCGPGWKPQLAEPTCSLGPAPLPL